MRNLMTQVKRCMSSKIVVEDGEIVARFIFDGDFIGFSGHFPGRPVLPGVCFIQAVEVAFSEFKRERLLLNEVVMAKFFLPVSKGQKVVFRCRYTEFSNGGYILKALGYVNDKKGAQLKLKFDRKAAYEEK